MNSSPMMSHPMECKCFTWQPVFVGALVALGLSFLLNLFGVAIGLTAFTTNSEGVENLAFGGLIAMALGQIASMFAAGWVAGYLSNRYCTKKHLGALYGFLAWCVALLIMIFLATHIQNYIGFYTHYISGTSTAVAQTMSGAASAEVTVPTSHVTISAYIVFGLFFLNAFAAALGGHCGMQCDCEKCV